MKSLWHNIKSCLVYTIIVVGLVVATPVLLIFLVFSSGFQDWERL